MKWNDTEDQIGDLRERIRYLADLANHQRLEGALKGEKPYQGALHPMDFWVKGADDGVNDQVDVTVQYGTRHADSRNHRTAEVSVPKEEIAKLLLKYLKEPTPPEGGE
jgi:hypothetical protein